MNKNDIDNISESNPSIKFRKKRTKSSIRLGSKMLMFMILAGLSGAFFSHLIIKYKYEGVINELNKNSNNEDMVIVNYANVVETLSESLVGIGTIDSENNDEFISTSTGIILDEAGLILTTYANINDINDIFIKLPFAGTKPIKAEFIGGDENVDVAILKVSCEESLTPVKLAKINETKVGQGIALISNPTGDGAVGSVIPGIITSTYKKIGNNQYNIMQVSAPIMESNDGAAICNSKGELIAIASHKITKDINDDKLYYAIDLRELEEIISKTTKFKDALGLVGGSVLKGDDSDIQGFYVQGVKKNGLADRSGIGPTDIIIKVDDIGISDSHDIEKLLKDKKSGDIIKLTIIKGGKEQELEIIVE